MNASHGPEEALRALAREPREKFAKLKEWIETVAFQALIHGPMQRESAVLNLPKQIASLERELEQARPIPIALVGRTGVGKSTILNALLGEDFLPVGVIGSQTAAMVTIRYAPKWQVTCELIGESELEQMFLEARPVESREEGGGSPELRERAEQKLRALLGLKVDAPELGVAALAGPPAELRQHVKIKRLSFLEENGDSWKEALDEHGRGKYWPLTKGIDVRGPFKMLEAGVVISDLPGAGDLNWARVNQAASAVNEAGQILIAVDGRFFPRDLMDQLETDGRLPHRLFREGHPLQIVLLGASLDKGLPDPDNDPQQVAELGVTSASASKQAVFAAVCDRWRERVVPEFGSWLRAKAAEFLPELSDVERATRVSEIMSTVRAIPTSANDWRRHRKGKPMEFCLEPAHTGIPELAEVINGLAMEQIRTTARRFDSRILELRSVVLSALERSESALGADIEAILSALQRSQEQMTEVQDANSQVIENLRLDVLERFQYIRELLTAKIESASRNMTVTGRKQVERHLDGVHWASLRATVYRQGLWQTGQGRPINLRDAMGGQVTRLVPQAWSQIVDQRVAKQVATAKTEVLSALGLFTSELLAIAQRDITKETDRLTISRLFDAGSERARVAIDRSADGVTRLLQKTSNEMQRLIDQAVQESLAEVCATCSDDSGQGWKNRSMARIIGATESIANGTQERCQAIADEAVTSIEQAIVEFCATAVSEMNKLSGDIPAILANAIETRLSSPQDIRQRLAAAREEAPEWMAT